MTAASSRATVTNTSPVGDGPHLTRRTTVTDYPDLSHIAPDLDRVALSSELWGLATRYTIEATLAQFPEDAITLQTNARDLAEMARSVITSGDIERADGYARAAALDIARVEAARRADWTIYERPTVVVWCRITDRHTPHSHHPQGNPRWCRGVR
jgi:hypothetical protein